MSIRYTTSSRPSSQYKNQKISSVRISKLLIARPKIKSQIQHLDLNEIFGFSKSPVNRFPKQNSFIINRKKVSQILNITPSPVSRGIQNYKKRTKKNKPNKSQKSEKITLGFSSSRKPENHRYQDISLEECES